MRKVLTILASVAAICLAATIATSPVPSSTVAAGLARGVIGGVILGSNVWPSTPADVQARLLLWSPDCGEQCGWAQTTPIDELRGSEATENRP
jgi:hypothetical protein